MTGVQTCALPISFTRQAEIPKYARLVPVAEIEGNDFNLNIPRYIDSTDPEDLQDIDGHLRGGIPERDLDALAAYWEVMPAVRAALFEDFDPTGGRPGYARLVPFDEIADAKNDFNLTLPRYIDSTTPEDLQDIDGHLRGGIPERDIDALDRKSVV